MQDGVPREQGRSRRWADLLAWGFLTLILIYLFLPNVLLGVMSLNSGSVSAFPLKGFTLSWWERMFGNGIIWSALRTSVMIATATTVLTVVLSFLSAFALVRRRFMLKGAFTVMLMSAMVVPYLVVGIALLSFWDALGVERGTHTVILAHVALALPFGTLVMAARLQRFDIALEEAAMILGASRMTVFRRITLPLMMPGVIAAAALAFTTSLDEFNVAYFLIGVHDTTLPIYVYSSLRFGASPELNAISTLTLAISMLLAIAALRRR